jgi:hypothetical protein
MGCASRNICSELPPKPPPGGDDGYWAGNSVGEGAFITGGGFHLVRLNGPFGVGSQFASLSAPGLVLEIRSREPSGSYLNGIQLLTANRLRLLGTC